MSDVYGDDCWMVGPMEYYFDKSDPGQDWLLSSNIFIYGFDYDNQFGNYQNISLSLISGPSWAYLDDYDLTDNEAVLRLEPQPDMVEPPHVGVYNFTIEANDGYEVSQKNFTYTITGNQLSIPDLNFENYLETHKWDFSSVNVGDNTSLGDGIDGNGYVTEYNYLYSGNSGTADLSNYSINDLTGNLLTPDFLYINNNNLSTVDLSHQTNLSDLDAGFNQITNLNLGQNTNLAGLDLESNL